MYRQKGTTTVSSIHRPSLWNYNLKYEVNTLWLSTTTLYVYVYKRFNMFVMEPQSENPYMWYCVWCGEGFYTRIFTMNHKCTVVVLICSSLIHILIRPLQRGIFCLPSLLCCHFVVSWLWCWLSAFSARCSSLYYSWCTNLMYTIVYVPREIVEWCGEDVNVLWCLACPCY